MLLQTKIALTKQFLCSAVQVQEMCTSTKPKIKITYTNYS